jgi:serine/threonine protein kinase
MCSTVKNFKFIDEGYQSRVFSAEKDNETIAIKQNIWPLDSVKTKRFNDECDILKSLNSPYILKYKGHIKGFIYLELMDSCLASEIHSSRFDEHLEKCILDIAMGLKYLHTLPNIIIHRDIKPENILVKKCDGSIIRSVICDFGFAVKCNGSKYIDTKCAGTPLFMAYEVITKKLPQYSPASDMWAFGVLCWFLITKKEPYKGIKTPAEYINKIKNGHRLQWEPEDIEKLTDSSLTKMIEKTWLQNPMERPSADDFINHLTQPTESANKRRKVN